MSRADESIFEKVLRVETKDIFVDLKKNKNGMYLKISERNGTSRNTVLIPASGLERLKQVLDEAVISAKDAGIPSRKGRKPRPVDAEVKSRSVYVSGLSYDTTDENLAAHMGQIGTVIKATVLRIKHRRSLGCGVVEYASRDLALRALTELNDSELGGRKIHCREDRENEQGEDDGEDDEEAPEASQIPSPTDLLPKPPQNNGNGVNPSGSYGHGNANSSGERAPKIRDEHKVFCSNLSWETTSEELLAHLSSVGEVTEVEILTRHGRSLGCGYAHFTDPKAVERAIAAFNNKDFGGRQIIVREYYQ